MTVKTYPNDEGTVWIERGGETVFLSRQELQDLARKYPVAGLPLEDGQEKV